MAKKARGTAPDPSMGKFAEAMHAIGYRFPLARAFDDFLIMSIAACTQNLATGKSYYEEEYLQVIDHYKDSELRHEFPKAFAHLVLEMEERIGTGMGNDVLGDFFEQNISNGRNGQFFTPYPVCEFMASITHTDRIVDEGEETERPLRILDPACGSGRLLLAAHRRNGPRHEYYGIDIDRTCAKIVALNMFLNGMWGGEVMCANALMPDDFVVSYRISFLPLGIFKVGEREKSKLWNIHRSSFPSAQRQGRGEDIVLDKTPVNERPRDNPTQLVLF